MKNILIVAPHPDDEVLGCGGVIKKYSKLGCSVFVLIITRGSPKIYSDAKINNVREEAQNAHKLLGVKETVFLEFIAPELDITPSHLISGDISKFINKWSIDVIFLPHVGDIHNDHKVVFQAGLVASRPISNCTVKEIYCYETLSETEWANSNSSDAFIPDFFVNIEEEIDCKISAFEKFLSQVKLPPHPRSKEGIISLAKYRGFTVSLMFAEAFMTIRKVDF